MKKVALLGDSIRMSYQQRVKELLADRAEVCGSADNDRFTKYLLWKTGECVKPDTDVIHWNNGLWDASSPSADGERFMTDSEYETNLRRILADLRKRAPAAKIIFATSTHVNDANKLTKNSDVNALNEIALRVMAEEGVEVNPLALCVPENSPLICDDNIHLTTEGVEAVAMRVAEAVGRYL